MVKVDPIYPALIVVTPLICAFWVEIFYWIKREICYFLALICLGAVSWFAIGLLIYILKTSSIVQYKLGGWPPPIGIEYRIDWLNGILLPVISLVGFINLIASKESIKKEFGEKAGIFYVLYLLFITGLLGVVITGDLFNLYVLLEITSLSVYAQIALANKGRAYLASLNYVFLGVIGASFYLLGVGYIYIMTGSLNMVDVFKILPHIYSSETITVAFIFCMVGLWIKMGLFPLHTWLPNAYTFAPLSASRVIAPLMTKVMIYVMIRLMFSVFGSHYVFGWIYGLNVIVVWMAAIAIIVGGFLALAQNDIRRTLCYIIISEIGYMVGGAWLGNQSGLTGAILHIINDMLMTFCLFLAVGNIIYVKGKFKINELKGLFKEMPLTSVGFVLVALSIIGIPPTCGFFSKWYLILGSFQSGQYIFGISIIISSLINIILFFKIFEKWFFEPFEKVKEAPYSMVASLLLSSLSLVLVGIYSGFLVKNVIMEYIPTVLG